jgi:hypothetical protein
MRTELKKKKEKKKKKKKGKKEPMFQQSCSHHGVVVKIERPAFVIISAYHSAVIGGSLLQSVC